LGNIAGENHKVRDMVISAKAVEPISRILDQALPGTSLVRNASWALSNFCRGMINSYFILIGRPSPDFEKIKRAIPSLAKVLIENDNEDVLIDVCWAMSYLSDGGEERIPLIL
jgi:importin subunit alpha-6/7